MIIPDRKKVAGVLLAKMDDPKALQPVASEGEFGEESSGLNSAAEDLMQAINDKSPIDLAKALVNFLELHEDHEASEGPEEEAVE